jgi:acetylornithine deacetylase/succinyl-diaminopimelate desuccinylase-like protein
VAWNWCTSPEEEAEQRYPWGKGYRRVSVLGRYIQSKRSHEGMHLSGYLDTVPAGRGWTRDPWKPIVEDGKLFGLGISDMKGGIASIIGVLRAFNDLSLEIDGDLTFSPSRRTKRAVVWLVSGGWLIRDWSRRAMASLLNPHSLT